MMSDSHSDQTITDHYPRTIPIPCPDAARYDLTGLTCAVVHTKKVCACGGTWPCGDGTDE